MKTFYRLSLLIAAIFMVAANYSQAQRVIKGTVYNGGKPVAGIKVEAHKGGTMMTSFDGKYEVAADAKSKYIKFTVMATDENKKLDIEGNTNNEIDFAFDGKMPGAAETGEKVVAGVSLKTKDELIQAKDETYLNEFSMYDQFYRQDDYNSALPHWKNLYNNYPKSHINVYIQGLKMYDALIGKAKTADEKEKLFKESMGIWDKRIKYFNQKGSNLGKKGAAYLGYYMNSEKMPEGDALKTIWKTGYSWLNESVTELGNESEPPVVLLLMQTTIGLFKTGEFTKETVVNNYEKSISILNSVVAKNKSKESVDNAKEVIKYVEDSFAKSGAADCETLIKFLTVQYKEKNNDIEFVKTMLRKLGKAKCDDSELYADATEKLYHLEPSPEAAYNMARRYVKKDDMVKAKEYYQMAIAQETDKERLADYYYEMALMYYKENNYPESRNMAKKAIENNPKHCESFMLIANIYYQASRSFGDAFERGTVIWVVVDYYERARAAGEDCAVDAAQKAAEFRRYYPSKEEGFMRDIKDGQGYRVGGWVNEPTRVRYN